MAISRVVNLVSGNAGKTSFLFRRYSVLLQFFNAVLHENVFDFDCTD